MSDSRLRRNTVVTIVVVSMVLGALLAEIACYSRNTPANHPNLVSGKQLIRTSMMGSAAASTRNALQRNRLNLGEWHGFNEYLFNAIWSFGSLTARVLLEEHAYAYLIYNRTAESFRAIRLSRNAALPSALVHCAPDGRFLDREVLADLELGAGWHDVELARHGDGLELRVDAFSCPIAVLPLPRQVAGFRSGRHPVLVDDVRATDAEGVVIVDEDFRNDRRWWAQFAVCTLVALVSLLSIHSFGRRTKKSARRRLFRTLLGATVAAVVLSAFATFDYLFWSRHYPYDAHTPWGRGSLQASSFERFRAGMSAAFAAFDVEDADLPEAEHVDGRYLELRRFLGAADRREHSSGSMAVIAYVGDRYGSVWIEPDKQTIDALLATDTAGTAYRILWIGTSQTWGAGANHEHERMAAQAHKILHDRVGAAVALRTVNASVRGGTPAEVARRHDELTRFVKPDLVVVNLSNNGPLAGFDEALRDIIRVAREDGSKVLFVLEPNSFECDHTDIAAKHAVMVAVAADTGTPVIEMLDFIGNKDRSDCGILWWDPVHMTSYGQQLAAEFIAAGIVAHFGNPTPR